MNSVLDMALNMVEDEVWVFDMVNKSHQPTISYMEVITDRSAHFIYLIIRVVLNPNILMLLCT